MSDTPAQPQRPYVGAILLLIKDGRLLLQRRTTFDELHHAYAPVAGKVDQYESPTDAIIREAYEEAGVILTEDALTMVCTLHARKRPYKGAVEDIVEYYFLAEDFNGTPIVKEPDKASSIGFFPLSDLPHPLVGNVPAVLSAIAAGRIYIEQK